MGNAVGHEFSLRKPRFHGFIIVTEKFNPVILSLR